MPWCVARPLPPTGTTGNCKSRVAKAEATVLSYCRLTSLFHILFAGLRSHADHNKEVRGPSLAQTLISAPGESTLPDLHVALAPLRKTTASLSRRALLNTAK